MTQPIFEIRNLSKTFVTKEAEVTALSGIDFDILEGEIFGVIGLSGAGKSTLIRCLNFLEKPSCGQVFFRGIDLAGLTPAELNRTRQSIGMIFQGFNLLEQRTCLQNIRFPLEIAGVRRDQANAKALELLRRVGLPDKEKAYPSQLSGGQKQRVAIARALATDPDVLLCDEATSALDPKTTDAILDLIKQINQELGVTVVIITHEMSVVDQICDRVAVMDQSQIAEIGNVHDVFVRPQSQIARQLILPKGELIKHVKGDRILRIVFDGHSAYEPIVSNMTLACQTPVSILSADSKVIDDLSYGQMVIQLPDDPVAIEKIRAYLDSQKITYEEELLHDRRTID